MIDIDISKKSKRVKQLYIMICYSPENELELRDSEIAWLYFNRLALCQKYNIKYDQIIFRDSLEKLGFSIYKGQELIESIYNT